MVDHMLFEFEDLRAHSSNPTCSRSKINSEMARVSFSARLAVRNIVHNPDGYYDIRTEEPNV